MATGAMDRDVHHRTFWLSAFQDGGVTDEEVAKMHPIRRLEWAPTPKGSRRRAEESKMGWALVRRYFHQQAR